MADTAAVVVRVPEPLRFLLPARDRAAGERRLRFDPDATVGHVVQAAGVPLTEAGTVRLAGEPVPPSRRTSPGAVISVDEAPRPQPVPGGGFLLDVGLGSLARRLRLLGLEAAWSPDADDADLAARAVAEDRMLLTQDRGLLMRGVVRSRGALVRGDGAETQLADVLDRFAPTLAPLTRCAGCGGRLEPAAKAEVEHLLQPGTRRGYADFSRCPDCGRVFWRGAHARRIDEMVTRAGGAHPGAGSTRPAGLRCGHN